MRPVSIVGASMTKFGKFLDRGVGSLSQEAVSGAMLDAGITPNDVEMVAFGNAAGGIIQNQEMIKAQVALQGTGLDGLPMMSVENACASASSAIHLAWLTIASGQADVAIAIGAEKMTHENKMKAFEALETAVDQDFLAEVAEESGTGSLFMDIYADTANAYMTASGATQRDLAEAAAKNHFHGSLNPKSQYQKALSAEEVLASRVIAGPLTMLMCSPIGDGAAALVLASEEYAKSHNMEQIKLLASSVQSGKVEGPDDVVSRAAKRAYETAGIGPDDLDVVELHDAASSAELVIYEELGLAAEGEGPKLLRSGDTRLGGRIPANVSGGLVSKGHPIGATGCAQVVDLVDQLRGRCGARQVEGARFALAENAGGHLGFGPAAAVVTILGKE